MREYLIIVRGTCVNWPEMYSLGSVGPIWPQMKLQIRPNWNPASRCPKLMTFHKAKGHSSHRIEEEHEHTPYGPPAIPLFSRCFCRAVSFCTTFALNIFRPEHYGGWNKAHVPIYELLKALSHTRISHDCTVPLQVENKRIFPFIWQWNDFRWSASKEIWMA